MKIFSAEYVRSAPGLDESPELGLPEVAMVGRSNVGKSSFINKLVDRKNLARTSNTPGKTRTLNFYRVNDQVVLVDLPGYGYAKVSRAQRMAWRKKLEQFLEQRESLVGVFLLVDARHGPQPNDLEMYGWLCRLDLPTMVVLTKMDKQKNSRIQTGINQAAGLLGLEASRLFAFSAATGLGRDRVLEQIERLADGFVRPGSGPASGGGRWPARA